jgi:hypothetical protein
MKKLSFFPSANNGVNTPSQNIVNGLEWQLQ